MQYYIIDDLRLPPKRTFHKGWTMERFPSLQEALAKVRGSYALAVLFRDRPDTIFAVKRESPLIVGWGEGENFVASDIPALLKYTRRYSVLEEGDMPCARPRASASTMNLPSRCSARH